MNEKYIISKKLIDAIYIALTLGQDGTLPNTSELMDALRSNPYTPDDPMYLISKSDIEEMSSLIDMLETSGATSDNVVWQVMYAWRGIEPQIRSRLAIQPELEKKIKDLNSSLEFYRSRCNQLQKYQSKMRDPERTIVCDILANGNLLLDLDGNDMTNRYGRIFPRRHGDGDKT